MDFSYNKALDGLGCIIAAIFAFIVMLIIAVIGLSILLIIHW